MNGIPTLFLVTGGMIALLFFVVYASQRHDLNSIQDRTVGHGQHRTARWATAQEVKRTYHHVPFTPELWRKGTVSLHLSPHLLQSIQRSFWILT